ncbi:MAG: Gx transporter family protein [Defluviitaleaceae bacterium]|nr:Gx transporter family protein [Defluviitaleaceae bacterium]
MKFSAKKLTFLGFMLALMVILIFFERMLPPLPMLPPQFSRLGLSNIIVMYIFFFVGKREAFLMAVMKAIFNLLMRGPMASLLSLSGGLFSVAVIFILWWVFRDRISYVALSIGGAIGHNLAQLLVACAVLQSGYLFLFYLPILLVAGVVSGTLTGISLRVIMPVFDKINGGSKQW